MLNLAVDRGVLVLVEDTRLLVEPLAPTDEVEMDGQMGWDAEGALTLSSSSTVTEGCDFFEGTVGAAAVAFHLVPLTIFLSNTSASYNI